MIGRASIALVLPVFVAAAAIQMMFSETWIRLAFAALSAWPFAAADEGGPGAETLEAARVTLRAVEQKWPIHRMAIMTDAAGGPLYRMREIVHLQDVQGVAQLAWQLFLGAAGALSLALVVARRRERIFAGLRAGSVLILVACVALAATLAIDFPLLWRALHQPLFPPGSFVFSAEDRIVQIFPLAFWALSGGVFVALQAAVACILLTVTRAAGGRGTGNAHI